MPTSQPENLTPVCQKILELAPNVQSALDIGVGIGKWGVLLREYLEVFPYWRFTRAEWKVRIDGVEIHKDYENPVWQIYDKVYPLEAYGFLQICNNYDLIIMIDVLEHFPKDQAVHVLNLMKARAKYVIFSYSNCDQKDVPGNQHEDHLSKWKDSDFPRCVKLCGVKDSWGTFFWV